MRHTVLMACGLGAALAFPALAEAGHRHSPSCGHPRSYGYVYQAPRAAYGYAPGGVGPRGYAAPRYYRHRARPYPAAAPVPVYGAPGYAPAYAPVYAPVYAPAYAPRYAPYYRPWPSVSLQLYGGPGGLHGNVGLFFGW